MGDKPVLMPSEVSERVGFFDRFAGVAALVQLTENGHQRDLERDVAELRDAVGLEEHESTSDNSRVSR